MRTAAVAALVVLSAAFILALAVSKHSKESFTGTSKISGEIECPIAATRTPDGKIMVQPGNQVFGTIQDYVAYLSGLYSQGSTCIPPMIKANKEPVDQILGGLGVGAPSPSDVSRQGAAREVLDTDFHGEQTSAKTPIKKLDDYEYTRVYQSERNNRNEASVGTINQLMEGRRLDWANLPFNSEIHATAADEFVTGRLQDAYKDPKTGIFFRNVEGGALLPPDDQAEKDREAKVLATYRPTSVTEHIIDTKTQQVARLVNQVYESDPNWTPIVEKVDENNYKVVELIPKPRKESYEEDAKTITLAMAEEKGQMIPPPSISIEDRMRGDPYFDKTAVGDRDNNRVWNYKDFNKWTPGLERMFAPTMDNKEWN